MRVRRLVHGRVQREFARDEAPAFLCVGANRGGKIGWCDEAVLFQPIQYLLTVGRLERGGVIDANALPSQQRGLVAGSDG